MTQDPVAPGQITNRAEMKALFGGGSQGGILPCPETSTVLIYSDPEVGEPKGYIDRWLPEDDEHGPVFEYTGHGEHDQTFTGPAGTNNRAILQHVDKARTLRVFKATGKRVGNTSAKEQRYVGAFELDAAQPYVVRQRPNERGVMRRVIVFRLRPLGPHDRRAKDTLSLADETTAVPVPADVTTSALVEPEKNTKTDGQRSAAPKTKAERREAKLSDKFLEFMAQRGHTMGRYQIQVKGTTSTLLTDLYDKNAHILYELKGTTRREAVRMAIGQLFDYRRHITPPNPTLAILLPSEPNDDLKALLAELGITLVYQDGSTFVGVPGLT